MTFIHATRKDNGMRVRINLRHVLWVEEKPDGTCDIELRGFTLPVSNTHDSISKSINDYAARKEDR